MSLYRKLGLDAGVLHPDDGPGTGGTTNGTKVASRSRPARPGSSSWCEPTSFGLPLWTLLLLAVAVLAIAAAIIVTRCGDDPHRV